MKTNISNLFNILLLTILGLLLVNVNSSPDEQNSYKYVYEPLYEYSDNINQETFPAKRYIRFGKRGGDDIMHYGGHPTLARHKTYSIYDLLKEKHYN
ncbi:hypothetical protein EWB00_010902 [Schistosoma japonicum]|uniref:Hypotheticial protein n=1 Tax=Schistosoma japonicum TaxID=6182 RepID=C1LE43_SCHJA|nr:hypothetical protein KSF78_0001230 [Schistosoma japonicum]TNN17732.1 hypothetical protein EWB00_010902 [Schistosoma japonicum]CAX72971.1 hypotheticial protein [Schistosoma japonicum]